MIRCALALLLAGLLCAGCSGSSSSNGGAGGPGDPNRPPNADSDLPYVTHTTPGGQQWGHPLHHDTAAQVAVIESEIDNTIPQNSPTGLTWREEGRSLPRGVWVIPYGWWSPLLPSNGRGYTVRGEHSPTQGWVKVQLGPPIGVAHVSGDPRLRALAHELAHELSYIPPDGNLCAEAGCPGRGARLAPYDPGAVFVGSR